jgi:hypothetical protein
MYRLLLTIGLITFFYNNILSQDSYKLEYFKKNKAIKDLKDYYQKKYLKDSNNISILESFAYYEYLNKDFEKSIVHYNRLFSLSKKKSLESLLNCGRALKALENYKSAKEIFKQGLIFSKEKKNRLFINFFNREIESVDWAIENKDKLSDIKFHETNLFRYENSNAIYNSNWLDSFLFLSYSNSIILEDIKNILYNPINRDYVELKNQLNGTKLGSFSTSTINNSKVYFSLSNSLINSKIAFGYIKNDSIINISIVKGLDYNDTTIYTMPNICEINNKIYLFYCSNNYNSKGGLDVFLGQINENDSVVKHINISNLNTPTDDVTPFYDEKTKIIYFSNSWMNGFGGLDVFKANFDDFKINKIQNIGKPFNSSYNDLYFNIKDSIYTITSNRNKTHTCCNNYYHFSKNKKLNELFVNEPSNQIGGNNSNKKSSIENYPDTVGYNFDIKQIERLFPIVLYFHNDIPNPKSKDTTTNIDYSHAFNDYLKLYNEYLVKNDKMNTKNEIDLFFENEIPKGFNDLNELLKLISEYILKGAKFKFIVKGFASPLASNTYNYNLSKRRISSILNYLKLYNNEQLIEYVNKSIEIEYIPYGEENSDRKVSDNPNNKKKSIYSIDAARERKIELVGIILK